MTVAEVQQEVQLLNLDNIRKFPTTRSKVEDFYAMWSHFGPEAARTIMIPRLVRYPVLRSSSMDDNTKYELMYRRPGAEDHENITDVLDDILNRLSAIEKKIED